MNASDLDPQKYGELLAGALPRVIDTPEEHEHFLTLAEALMDKGDALTREERKLLELLVFLIESFERQVEAEDDEPETEEVETVPEPHETLKRLLDSRGWEEGVLNDIFGNPLLVREVLSGRRAISRGQAKGLGKLFRVPQKLFERG